MLATHSPVSTWKGSLLKLTQIKSIKWKLMNDYVDLDKGEPKLSNFSPGVKVSIVVCQSCYNIIHSSQPQTIWTNSFLPPTLPGSGSVVLQFRFNSIFQVKKTLFKLGINNTLLRGKGFQVDFELYNPS